MSDTLTRRECSICGAEVRGQVWGCNHVYTDPEPSPDPYLVTTTRTVERTYVAVDALFAAADRIAAECETSDDDVVRLVTVREAIEAVTS